MMYPDVKNTNERGRAEKESQMLRKIIQNYQIENAKNARKIK